MTLYHRAAPGRNSKQVKMTPIILYQTNQKAQLNAFNRATDFAPNNCDLCNDEVFSHVNLDLEPVADFERYAISGTLQQQSTESHEKPQFRHVSVFLFLSFDVTLSLSMVFSYRTRRRHHCYRHVFFSKRGISGVYTIHPVDY